MRYLPLAMLSGVFLLTACEREQAVPPPQTGLTASAGAVASEAALDESRLGQFHWRLHDATDSNDDRIGDLFGDINHRVQFDFANNQLSVSGSCNAMNGSYTIEKNTFKAGRMMQTMKACDDALMRREGLLKDYLEDSWQVSLNDSDAPLLTLTHPDSGVTLIFEGLATAEHRYGGAGEQIFFEVQPLRVACQHPLIPDYECLQVRERVYSEDGLVQSTGEWQMLYQDIEGYHHEEGQHTVLRLKRFPLVNPPADGPGIAYVLDMVVQTGQREENLPVE